jgi:hypothetical protein
MRQEKLAFSTPKQSFTPLPPGIDEARQLIESTDGTSYWIGVPINSQLAKLYLERNHPDNRKPGANNVNKIARDYVSGNWQYPNGDTLRFDENGYLIDGCNRMTALASLNTEQCFYFDIITGLKVDAFKTIDQGRTRTAVQALRMTGINITRIEAALARSILWSPSKNIGTSEALYNPSTSEVEDSYRRFQDGITLASKFYSSSSQQIPSVPIRSNVVRAYYSPASKWKSGTHRDETLSRFLQILDTGITIDNPSWEKTVITLRNRYEVYRRKNAHNTNAAKQEMHDLSIGCLKRFVLQIDGPNLRAATKQFFYLPQLGESERS